MQFAPLYPVARLILQPILADCLWEGSRQSNVIALTFDDGPHPQHTPALLEVLSKYQVPASFFWLGACVTRSPQIARAAYQQGHWMGLHGFSHRPFPTMKLSEIRQELTRTQEAIALACDLDLADVQRRVRDVRPPYGIMLPSRISTLRQWGYRPVMWGVVPEDWVRPGIAVAAQRILSQVSPGSLIVLHDGYTGGEDVAAITNTIIPILLERGYQFVTIDPLWQTKRDG
jgi:peptidoglycan/xylan/chitin deacetylase (PgdA/CDA1 family)